MSRLAGDDEGRREAAALVPLEDFSPVSETATEPATNPGLPSDAELRGALAVVGRGGLACAGLAISGLAQVLGLAALSVAVVRWAFGEPGWEPMGSLGAASLLGGLVALTALFRAMPDGAGLRHGGLREPDASEVLRQASPDEPWRWNEEWATGRLRGRVGATSALFALAAAGAAALALPMVLVVWRSSPPDLARWRDDPAGLARALLPSAAWLVPALLLAGLALRLWLVRWRFGASTFEMSTLPGAIGGRLEGRILTGLGSAPKAIRLRLVCTRWALDPPPPGSSGRASRRIGHSELWSAERSVPPADLYLGPRGAAVPVAFDIPSGCRPTVWRSPAERISWTLLLHVVVLGIDLEAGWVVPVFTLPRRPAA